MGILDNLLGGGGGSGLLGAIGGQNPLLSDPLTRQALLMSGLGLASGATASEGFKNTMPALQSVFDQQQAQRAGMALLNALPGQQQGQQPQAAPQAPAAAPGMAGTPNFGNAIAGIESKGQPNPYAAVGPTTKSGDQAYGKYQVMGANVGPWTKEILGQEMTPQQFIANPQAQDAVFNGKFNQYLQQTGNPQDAASMWFTGKPLAQGANRSDVNGMTGQQYVNQFTQNLSGAQPQAPQVAPQGPTSGPQIGGNLPASGMQVIASPAIQGMPDTLRRAIPIMLASKQYAPQAMQLLQKYINPEQYQLVRDSMGNVFSRNTVTNETKPVIQTTPDIMNANASGAASPLQYDYFKNLGASAAKNTELTPEQKNAGLGGVGTAGAGGINPVVQFEGQKTVYGGIANDMVDAQKKASPAQQRIQQLDTIGQALQQGGGNITTGPFAEMALKAKQAIGSAFNIDLAGVPQAEVAQKTGMGLAIQSVKELTNRGTQFELKTALQNNPGLLLSPTGSQMMISILKQSAQQDIDIAKLASNPQNLGNWQEVKDAYYKAHPIISPFTGKPVGDADVKMLQQGGGGQTQAAPVNPYEAEMRRRKLLQ